MTEGIRLIIGLGNPGADYEKTRHNAGFWLADEYAKKMNASFSLDKNMAAWVAKGRFDGQPIIIAKPTTFMNRSGQAAGALMRFYKLKPEQVLVLHDELDLLPGQAKLKKGGGHAGHNGLRDIQQVFSSPDYWRMRIGIGHPRSLGLAQQVAAFVLSPPRAAEREAIEDVLWRADAILTPLLEGNFDLAIQQLHGGNG
ncbi:aminoacyl-tRNA hydrolase [Paenalcaligenes hominis]|uniref:aminoacyl-tRNA hydrolase n=1 Tax=Paenalcaligenes hominis TaxID=643674 RepID=UPI003525685C